jgi:RimJ/RimL family protein N-acetyltransferase
VIDRNERARRLYESVGFRDEAAADGLVVMRLAADDYASAGNRA